MINNKGLIAEYNNKSVSFLRSGSFISSSNNIAPVPMMVTPAYRVTEANEAITAAAINAFREYD